MKTNFKILLVEDMASFRDAVSQLLGVYNDVEEAGDLASARQKLLSHTFDVIILDKSLPDGKGISLIPEIKIGHPNAVIIILTSDSDFNSVKHCIALGADDYVIKSENIVPDLLIRIPVAVSKAASNRRLSLLEQQVKEAFRYEIIGKSVPTMQLRETIASLKNSNASVLISGESGTGKELIARRLNAIEDDGKRPFVAVNCGAIPENLIESELFGHKKGSFTGATQDRPGRFELAHGGDLFLDEIGEMPMAAQVRLLRVLQEGEISRVGDNRPIKVSCRIIAATNKNLEAMIKSGEFREDLYHRLNVVWIRTTPLRFRMNDVGDLARFFTLQIGGPAFKVSDHAIAALNDYDWPGNIRELRNSIERAIISARKRKSAEIAFEDISYQNPLDNISYRKRKIEGALPTEPKDVSPDGYRKFFEIAEREYLKSALEAIGGSAEDVAEAIGLGRSTVFRRLRKLGVKAKDMAPTKVANSEHSRDDRRLI